MGRTSGAQSDVGGIEIGIVTGYGLRVVGLSDLTCNL